MISANDKKLVFLNEITTATIDVAPNTHLLLACGISKGWSEKQTLTINLSGEGASLDCFFALIGFGDATFPFDLIVNHVAKATRSAIHIRTVLNDTSRVDSKGYIWIAKSGGESDTYFSHHALLLSPTTRAHILPSLEIEHNNVKAGHAVTIGRVDEEILFYCASRGISAREASQLITRGFLLADSKLIRDSHERELFREKIDSELYAEQK
ncbi:MAG: SufD family Fe-S cluster assembly protein [Patescibacteria group bacterium]